MSPPRRIDRILRRVLEGTAVDVGPHCAEPLRPEDGIVVVMGEERHDPGAGVPRCRSCAEPLRSLDEVVVVVLRRAVRVSAAA